MMEEVLKKIAGLFNKANITWALGGSWVLKKHGFNRIPHDIDIMVVEGDIDRAKEIMETIGEETTNKPQGNYNTKYFFQYIVNGVEVDIMCKFIISYQGMPFNYLFDKQSISDVEYMGETRINYSSVEDWYVLYCLMDRPKDNLHEIEKYLITKGIKNTYLFKRIMLDVPDNLHKEIVSNLKLKRDLI